MTPFLLERTVDPCIEPVTLAEMRRQVKMPSDLTDDDADLLDLITVAREWAEDYTGRALVDQTWRLTLAPRECDSGDTVTTPRCSCCGCLQWDYTDREIKLRRSPVIEIVSFVSVDDDGTETAVDVGTPPLADWELRDQATKEPRLFRLTGASWPSGTLRIVFRAGYATGLGSPGADPDLALVPARFKHAIRLYAQAHYDQDERMMEKLIAAATNLLRPERCELSLA